MPLDAAQLRAQVIEIIEVVELVTAPSMTSSSSPSSSPSSPELVSSRADDAQLLAQGIEGIELVSSGR